MKINISRDYQGFDELQNALVNASTAQLKGLSQNDRKICKKVVELMKNPDKALVSFTVFNLKSQPNLKEIAQKVQNGPRESDSKGLNLLKGMANIISRISSKSLSKQISKATTTTQKFIYSMNISEAEKKKLLALDNATLKEELVNKVNKIVKSPPNTSNQAAKSDEDNYLMIVSNILRSLGDNDNPIHEAILKRMHPFLRR